MSDLVGQTLSCYEVLERIGAGGMGEVFLARDSKLERNVAIKVLPDAFARDEERMLRFEREAKVLASLNHPNIAAMRLLWASFLFKRLRMRGLEPPRGYPHWHLKPARLPIPPHPQKPVQEFRSLRVQSTGFKAPTAAQLRTSRRLDRLQPP